MASPLSALSLLVLVSVTVLSPEGASAALGKMSDKSAFFKHYSKFMVLSHCFGDETVMAWHVYVDNLLMECQGEVREKKALIREVRSLGRMKREEEEEDSQYYSADKVRLIKNKMMNKIMFLNCTMNKMNMTISPEGGVETEDLIGYYKTLALDDALMADLEEGIKKCGKAATCGEFPSYGPIDENFQKKFKFMKCEQEARLTSCVRKDLRLLRGQFDFEGLDGLLDDVSDDEDKMFAILSAKATLDESHMII